MSSLPAPSYHVVGRSNGESRFDRYSASLYEGTDLSVAHDAFKQGVEVAKRAAAATVTIYRLGADGRLRVVPGCRFDGAAWRARLQPAGAPVALGGAS